MATAAASGDSVSQFHQQLQLCRHQCSHQQQQHQKQEQHHVKWKPDLPDRVLKPKLPPNKSNNNNGVFSSSAASNSSSGPSFCPSHTRSSFIKDASHLGGRDVSNTQNVSPHRRSNSVNPMVAKVSALPRKWCDFVFRRNHDNNLYKSESFRFIQKTSSLEPLLPKNAYIRNRLRKTTIPVSDDYVEPLDQLISSSTSGSYSQSQNSGSDTLNAGFGQESEEPSYHEIPEKYNTELKYNAPYYYSDTLKTSVEEPQAPAPEESTPQENESNGADDSGKIPSITFILYNHHETCPLSHISPVNTSKLRERSRSCHCFFSPEEAQSAVSMARKRYETAFLPTNCPPTRSSPDVDSMLRGIESPNTFTLDNNTGEMYLVKSNALEDDFKTDLLPRSMRRDFSNPHSKYNAVTGVTIIHCHPHSSHNSPVGSRADTIGSTISSSMAKVVPLSEPLPQKKYISYMSTGSSSNQSTSSTGCSTTMSSSPSQTSSRTGSSGRVPRLFELSHNRNNMAVLLKDNSVSSLESIDSLTSEDTKCSHNTSNSCQLQRLGQQLKTAKLLSPISDKSPLEPPIYSSSSVSNSQQNTDEYNYSRQQQPSMFPTCNDVPAKPTWTPQNLKSAVELTNVPWEMPKLRRKLALLADSGISLDFQSTRVESEDNSYINNKDIRLNAKMKDGARNPEIEEPKVLSRPNFQNTSSHIRANLNLGLNKSNEFESQLSYHECEADEYYEPQSLRLGLPKLPTTLPPSLEPNGKRCRPDKAKMTLDFGVTNEIDPTIELDAQEWFHGAITRVEAENILRTTKEGSFLVRNCESSTYCRYSLSIKSSRGFIHIRIEPNSLGTFSLAEHEFPTVSHMVLHFMSHRLPIKGAEHVKLKYPVITQLL